MTKREKKKENGEKERWRDSAKGKKGRRNQKRRENKGEREGVEKKRGKGDEGRNRE